jgi:hypothetical protein
MFVCKVKINIIDFLCFVDTFISLPADFGELAFNPSLVFIGAIIIQNTLVKIHAGGRLWIES